MSAALTIRPATPDDVVDIGRMLEGLAAHDGLQDAQGVDLSTVRRGLFGAYRFAEALMAERPEGRVGVALFFQLPPGFFIRRGGLFLEHLWVDAPHRRAGVGQALLTELARIAVERKLVQVEWSVISGNESARRFYERLGATFSRDMALYRLEGEALGKLGEAPLPG